ncbi:hypothetical protein [Acidovorax sp. ST3]|uniref:hypothetical protein n=1 Tax=Acidovorax sp. ST3 TaxID=2219062 RepID=UPI00193E2FF2|nr:hypothetical protein [Acidovorax sp. ST3]
MIQPGVHLYDQEGPTLKPSPQRYGTALPAADRLDHTIKKSEDEFHRLPPNHAA